MVRITARLARNTVHQGSTLTDLQSRSFSLDVALVRALGGGYSTQVH